MIFLLISYFLLLVSFTIYSYSQVDLNLTLSSNSFYQLIQQKLTYLGYFNRPLSGAIFASILILLFIYYFAFYFLIKKNKLKVKSFKKIIIITVGILLFSYPAFSHDIFNYIFDTRIAIYHKLSPWTHAALDFPQDTWIRFMRWTHRTFPYGPAWLGISSPFYLLGLGKFILTLLSFKLLGAIGYLSSCYLIYKLTSSSKSLAIFAFNPLILISALNGAHLDIIMTALFLWALYLKKQKILSWLALIASALTKYVTFIFFPFWFLMKRIKRPIFWLIILSLISAAVQIILREFNPWYLILPLAVISLSHRHRLALLLSFLLSLFPLFRYLYFVYTGEYL